MPDITHIENDHLSVDVSSLGAEMQALTASGGRALLWNGDASFWTGRSPILFPIVGKAPGDVIAIDGHEYPMAQHGFARRREFTLAAADSTRCRMELADSEETRAVYPFAFLLAVEHALDGPRLTVSAEVTNRSDTAMPFGLGFHPAFLWPLPGGEGADHLIHLDNGAEPELARLEAGLLSARRQPSPFTKGELTLETSMFEADAMIFPEGAGAGLTYGPATGPRLRFTFENLPNLALWQKLGAPFICIEPWHGTAAALGASNEVASRPYSLSLDPGATARFAFTVEVI